MDDSLPLLDLAMLDCTHSLDLLDPFSDDDVVSSSYLSLPQLDAVTPDNAINGIQDSQWCQFLDLQSPTPDVNGMPQQIIIVLQSASLRKVEVMCVMMMSPSHSNQ